VTQIKNITNTISCATYSLDYNYAIVGHLAGPISFYRVTSTIIPTLPTHTFQGHQRSINSLLIHPKKNYLLFSASLDATIKIWNIDTFTALFSYPLNVEVTNQIIFLAI
jgi:WD40 repeat protein